MRNVKISFFADVATKGLVLLAGLFVVTTVASPARGAIVVTIDDRTDTVPGKALTFREGLLRQDGLCPAYAPMLPPRIAHLATAKTLGNRCESSRPCFRTSSRS